MWNLLNYLVSSRNLLCVLCVMMAMSPSWHLKAAASVSGDMSSAMMESKDGTQPSMGHVTEDTTAMIEAGATTDSDVTTDGKVNEKEYPPIPANMTLERLGHYYYCILRFNDGWWRGVPGLVYSDNLCICLKDKSRCRENVTFLLPPAGEYERHLETMRDLVRNLYRKEQIAYSIVLCLAIVLGVFGNSMVLHSVRRYMTKASSTNVFICNLAVADLLVNLICTPVRIITMIYGDWMTLGLGVWPCRLLWYLYYVSFMVSVFTMTAMSIERYMAVVHPMKAQYLSTVTRARRVVALLWVLGGALSLPFLFLAYQVGLQCVDFLSDVQYGPYFSYMVLVVLLLVPITIMGVAYGRTAHVLLRSIREARKLHAGGSNQKDAEGKGHKEKDDTRGRLQVVVMLLLMVLLFAICWCPYNVFRVVRVHRRIRFEERIEYFGVTLTLVSSCLNPLLYVIFSKQFRGAFKKIMCSRCSTAKQSGLESTSGSSQTLSTSASSSIMAAIAKENNSRF